MTNIPTKHISLSHFKGGGGDNSSTLTDLQSLVKEKGTEFQNDA